LWSEIHELYTRNLSEDVLSFEHLLKLDLLILSHEVDQIRNGLTLLIGMGCSEYLCRYVTWDGLTIVLRKKPQNANDLILEDALLTVVKVDSKWKDLHEHGAFASMLFRKWNDAQFENLSTSEQDCCVRLSKQVNLLSANTFLMGALEEDVSALRLEKPRHPVTLTRDFLIGKYAVTQGLWERIMDSNPSRFKGASRPVEQVRWLDCVVFCNKLSKLEGLESAYTINGDEVQWHLSANGYRLPTEAEWEYAARGGVYQRFSGSKNPTEVAWYGSNSNGQTHPVGQKQPNGFELYDMSGNVYEWVWDLCSPYTAELAIDPKNARSNQGHVFRGGCWLTRSRQTRVSFRICATNDVHRGSGLGFRIARTFQTTE
jgi:formylglycine-generating enzyme